MRFSVPFFLGFLRAFITAKTPQPPGVIALTECIAALGADFFIMRAGCPVLIPTPATAALTTAHLKRKVRHEGFAAVQAGFFHKGLSIFILQLPIVVLAAALVAAKQTSAMAVRIIVYDCLTAMHTVLFAVFFRILAPIVGCIPAGRTAILLVTAAANEWLPATYARFWLSHLALAGFPLEICPVAL